MTDVRGWREEARNALEEYKVDAWREWAPEWLVPSLFVKELQVMGGEEAEEMQEGSRVRKDRACVEVIEEKYRRLQDEVAAAMERGDMEPEEAVERSEGLEKELEREMEKVRDFERWEKGGEEDSEIEELSEEEVKKAKARAKGKEKEKKEEKKEEKKKRTTCAKRRRIEDSDGEEDMAPSGWRPLQGSQVRSKYTIS